MSKAAMAKLRGVNVDRLHDLLQRSKSKRYTIDDVANLIGSHPECLPDNWLDTCKRRALVEVARSVVQTAETIIDDRGTTARLIYTVNKRERQPDGTIKTYRQYVRWDGLVLSEWDEVLINQVGEAENAKRRANATTSLYNQAAALKKWPERELPYPEAES